MLTSVLLMGALAQVRIPLSWTPVPVTGQTLGVALVAMLFGARMGASILGLYLTMGFVGLPLFALKAPGTPFFGPTLGYLLGMFVASMVMGYLADKGFTKTFKGAFLTAICGSLCTFALGLTVLSYFVPNSMLLAAGLLPFIPGDFIKNTVAALIVSSTNKRS